jgi:hypothetical protein
MVVNVSDVFNFFTRPGKSCSINHKIAFFRLNILQQKAFQQLYNYILDNKSIGYVIEKGGDEKGTENRIISL